MTARALPALDLGNRDTVRAISRAFSYVRPFAWSFAVKIVLTTLSLMPLLLLPWPLKILIDHVVVGIPIGEASGLREIERIAGEVAGPATSRSRPELRRVDIVEDYVEHVLSVGPGLRRRRVALDCGDGLAAAGLGSLKPLMPGVENPFPWLAEMMDIKKEQNFFEGRVTEYQKASVLETVDDDDL